VFGTPFHESSPPHSARNYDGNESERDDETKTTWPIPLDGDAQPWKLSGLRVLGEKLGKYYCEASRKEKRNYVKNAKDGEIAEYVDCTGTRMDFLISSNAKHGPESLGTVSSWRYHRPKAAYFWRKKSLGPL
jgi:hypothetical protein